MSTIHFIEGPVGAGKSTYARALAARKGGVHIALDEWFIRLYSADRPPVNFADWYIERKTRLAGVIVAHARAVVASGQEIVLELGMIQRAARKSVLEQIKRDGLDLALHILDAPLEVRRERVKRRNVEQGATFSMVVPDHIFDIASAMWEAPDEHEMQAFAPIFPDAIKP